MTIHLSPPLGSSPGQGRRTVDPAGVHTVGDLVAALKALADGRSYTALNEAVGGRLPKQTLSDMLTKGRPSEEKLELFLRACGVAREEWATWRSARERALSEMRPGLAGLIRVEQSDPRRLGVHAAIDVPDAVGDLPIYVERDTDTDLRGIRALIAGAVRGGRGGMVVLVGSSSVGKSRCAYEAITALVPQWWLLHPVDAEQVRQVAVDPPQRLVVWLDELKRFLGGPAGLTAASVRTLMGKQQFVS